MPTRPQGIEVELLEDRLFLHVPEGVVAVALLGIDAQAVGLELRLSRGLHRGPLGPLDTAESPSVITESWALYGKPSKQSRAEGDERRVVFLTHGATGLTVSAVDADGAPVPPETLGPLRAVAVSPGFGESTGRT